MNKYKVEIVKKSTFVVDVLAKNEEEATTKAQEKWLEIGEMGTEHYYQNGNTEVEVGTVYDVTNTDDPFNP
jgi:hypothetical protein